MSSQKIGALAVDLSLESEGFIQGLKEAQLETKQLVKEYRPAIDAAKELGETLSLVGDVVAIAMFEATEKAAAYGAELKHLSEKSGATVEDLAKLAYAADQNGSSMDGLGTGLKFLSKNMELAQNGSDKQQHAFEALGISAKDLNETGGSSSAMFTLLSDRITKMNDPSTHAADLIAVLGKNWTELLPTLKLGSEGLKAAGEEAERLNVVISDEAAEADLKYEQTMKQVKTAVEGVANSIASALLPQLQPLSEAFRNAIADTGQFVKQHQTLAAAVFDSSAAIGAVGAGLLAIGFGAGPAIKAFDNLKDVGKLSMEALGSFATVAEGTFGPEVVMATGLIGKMSAAIEGASLALTGPVGWTIAAVAATAGIVALINQTEAGHAIIVSIKDAFVEFSGELIDTGGAAVDFARDMAGIAWDEFKAQISDAVEGFKFVVESVRDASTAVLEFVGVSKPEALSIISEGLELAVIGPWKNAKLAISAAKDTLKQYTDQGPPPPLMPLAPDPKDLAAISKQMKDASKEVSDAWGESAKEIAAEQKKLRQDESKANDEYYASLVSFYKNQRTLGKISNDDLISDLIFAEMNRYAAEDHADGNLLSLAAKHESNLQKIRQDGAAAQAVLDLARQRQEEADIKQTETNQAKADTDLINALLDVYKQKWILGGMSAAALRDQQIRLEDEKWAIIVGAGKATEGQELQHHINLLNVESDYQKNSVALDATSEEERKFMRENDVHQQEEIYKQQHTATVILAKDELEIWKKHQKEVNALGEQISKEWTQSMKNLAGSTAGAIAGMVTDWDFNAQALVNIAKNTAESMLQALLKGMITPLTNELAKLGTSLTDAILGISQTKTAAGGIGSVTNGGGLLGLGGQLAGSLGLGGLLNGGSAAVAAEHTTDSILGGLFQVSGGAPVAGGTASTTGTAGSSALGAVVPFAMPFLAALPGIVIGINNEPHYIANKWTAEQAQFDSAMAQASDEIAAGVASGRLSASQYAYARNQISSSIGNYLDSLIAFRDSNPAVMPDGKNHSGYALVGDQALDTFYQYYGVNGQSFLSGLDAIATGLPQYALGTPWVDRDGPAFLHRGEAVIPAAINATLTAGKGQQRATTITVSPVYEINMSFTSATENEAIRFRDKIMPELKIALRHNIDGLVDDIAYELANSEILLGA